MSAQIARDVEGYLVNPDEWSEDLARELAREEGIELDDEYWAILKFMRDYYAERGVIPDVRHVSAFLARRHGISTKEGKKKLFTMFPYGYVKQACKIAGMKRPRSWSTG
jgi:tRNA 2-thiouridine synthesizing protein E